MKRPKRAPLTDVNAQLRQWTRGISFTLAMGKLQVALLVAMHLSQERSNLVGRNHRRLTNFITGARCLEDRGLVVHHPWNGSEEHARRKKYREFFQITAAGELVVGLLKLSGIYDELRLEFEASERQSLRVVA